MSCKQLSSHPAPNLRGDWVAGDSCRMHPLERNPEAASLTEAVEVPSKQHAWFRPAAGHRRQLCPSCNSTGAASSWENSKGILDFTAPPPMAAPR